MSEFIKNHPSAIEVFIFHQKGKEGSFRKMYNKLCTLIGENGISEEEFERIFVKIMMADEESRKKEIRQLVVHNQANLRICILSDAIDKKSIIESFLSITKMIGTHDIDEMIESKVIEYQDFEFWFNRFSSGNLDLDQKTFSDLPLFLISNIVEQLEFRAQIKLRRVSHGLRNIVDQVRPSIDHLCFEFIRDDSKTAILNVKTKKHFKSEELYNFYSYTGEDYLERAFNDMKILLSNPRFHLDAFIWDNKLETEIDEKLIDILKKLNHKLEIVYLNTTLNKDLMIDLLKAVKPGTLKYIFLKGNYESSDINRVAQLDQWKKAENVRFTEHITDFFDNLHHFQHFEFATVGVRLIKIDDLLALRQLFTESDKLVDLKIITTITPSELEIKETLNLTDFHSNHDSFNGRYDIPDTNNYLKVCSTWYGISFYKETAR